MQQPKIGSDVLVYVNPSQNNGERVAAAKVTRVLETEEENDVRVNLRVFLDTGADMRFTNVPLVNKSDAQNQVFEEPQGRVAFWNR